MKIHTLPLSFLKTMMIHANFPITIPIFYLAITILNGKLLQEIYIWKSDSKTNTVTNRKHEASKRARTALKKLPFSTTATTLTAPPSQSIDELKTKYNSVNHIILPLHDYFKNNNCRINYCH